MIYKIFNIKAVSIKNDIEESIVPCGTCSECCIKLTPILTPDEFMSGKYMYTLLTSPEPNSNLPTISIPKNNQGCYYFKNNKCEIYENRPLACRQFDCRKGHYSNFKNLVLEKFGIDIENE